MNVSTLCSYTETLLWIDGGLIGLILLYLSGLLRYIPHTRVGIVEKRVALRGSVRQGFIAMHREAGFQPNDPAALVTAPSPVQMHRRARHLCVHRKKRALLPLRRHTDGSGQFVACRCAAGGKALEVPDAKGNYMSYATCSSCIKPPQYNLEALCW